MIKLYIVYIIVEVDIDDTIKTRDKYFNNKSLILVSTNYNGPLTLIGIDGLQSNDWNFNRDQLQLEIEPDYVEYEDGESEYELEDWASECFPV